MRSEKYRLVVADGEETLQMTAAGRMTHLLEGLGLDLADALARHFELPAQLFERAAVAIDEAKPQLKHLALALADRAEDVADLLLG